VAQIGQRYNNYTFSAGRTRESLYNRRSDDDELAKIYLRIDNEAQLIERSAYDVFAFMGEIGGVSQVIVWLAGVFVSIYARQSFYATMIEKLYHVKKFAKNAFDVSRKADSRKMKKSENGGK